MARSSLFVHVAADDGSRSGRVMIKRGRVKFPLAAAVASQVHFLNCVAPPALMGAPDGAVSHLVWSPRHRRDQEGGPPHAAQLLQRPLLRPARLGTSSRRRTTTRTEGEAGGISAAIHSVFPSMGESVRWRRRVTKQSWRHYISLGGGGCGGHGCQSS